MPSRRRCSVRRGPALPSAARARLGIRQHQHLDRSRLRRHGDVHRQRNRRRARRPARSPTPRPSRRRPAPTDPDPPTTRHADTDTLTPSPTWRSPRPTTTPTPAPATPSPTRSSSTNTGPSAVTGAVVTDSMPSGHRRRQLDLHSRRRCGCAPRRAAAISTSSSISPSALGDVHRDGDGHGDRRARSPTPPRSTRPPAPPIPTRPTTSATDTTQVDPRRRPVDHQDRRADIGRARCGDSYTIVVTNGGPSSAARCRGRRRRCRPTLSGVDVDVHGHARIGVRQPGRASATSPSSSTSPPAATSRSSSQRPSTPMPRAC